VLVIQRLLSIDLLSIGCSSVIVGFTSVILINRHPAGFNRDIMLH